MSQQRPTFRIRLRVLIGKPLTSDESSKSFWILGREVTILSQKTGEPLSQTRWLVFRAAGFATEYDALSFGAQLKHVIQVACAGCWIGVDIGRDISSSHVGEQIADLVAAEGDRLAQNVHGLLILPDDERTRILILEGTISVSADPNIFITAMEQSAQRISELDERTGQSLKVLNLALLSPDPLAQIVLAFAAVEHLADVEKWSASQLEFLGDLALQTTAAINLSSIEKAEIADAVTAQMQKLSVRQSIKRLLIRLSLDNIRAKWEEVYRLRSKLVHGHPSMNQLAINALAFEVCRLAARIVLSAIQGQGSHLPKIAETNFMTD